MLIDDKKKRSKSTVWGEATPTNHTHLEEFHRCRPVFRLLLQAARNEVDEHLRPVLWPLQPRGVILCYVIESTHGIHVEKRGLAFS